MTTHSGYDRLLMGSPLRRGGVSKGIAASLLVILAFATLVQLAVFTSMPPGLFSVFLRALALSTLLAMLPLAMLWFLDRRERESPWLFAAAFLWGGLIATALASLAPSARCHLHRSRKKSSSAALPALCLASPVEK